MLDDGSAGINVKGKGGKERNIPIETALLDVIGTYIDSRAARFPQGKERTSSPTSTPLSGWPHSAPLFVGRDGERMTRGTLQSRIKRAFKRAGTRAPYPAPWCTAFASPGSSFLRYAAMAGLNGIRRTLGGIDIASDSIG